MQRTTRSTLMLHSGSSKDYNHFCLSCLGSIHRLGLLRATRGSAGRLAICAPCALSLSCSCHSCYVWEHAACTEATTAKRKTRYRFTSLVAWSIKAHHWCETCFGAWDKAVLYRNAQYASASLVGLLASATRPWVSPGSALSCSVIDIISEE